MGSQPILALFLAIGLGYLVGQINIFGLLARRRRGAVRRPGDRRHRAQIADHRADRADRPDDVPLRHRHPLRPAVLRRHDRVPGRRYNLLAFVAVIVGLFVALALGEAFRLGTGQMLGLFAGSMTSTATLQAALDFMARNRPVGRLFGRLSVRRDRTDPVLLFHDPDGEAAVSARTGALPHGARSRSAGLPGHTAERADREIARGRQVSSCARSTTTWCPTRHGAHCRRRGADCRRQPGGDRRGRRQAGQLEPGRIGKDRGDLTISALFVSKASLIGIPLAQLPLPSDYPIQILHIRRYDIDIVPSPTHAGVRRPHRRAGAARAQQDVRAHFGDTVRSTAEFTYISLGIGMVLGVLLGPDPDPDPGHRQGDARHHQRAADRRADRRPTAPHRADQLGDAAARQHRAAQFRADAVPCRRRHQFRPAFVTTVAAAVRWCCSSARPSCW